jgi:hypothetical protein
MSKKDYIHAVKGPTALTSSEITDIVNRRDEPKAREVLAKEYGISSTRVVNIWKMYYGGSTLADFKTGLKKPLPKEPVPTASFTKRSVQIEGGGKYTTYAPKTENFESRAKARRVHLNKPTKEDVDIIEGEIDAGNNNPDLIDALERMAENIERSSKNALKTSKIAQKIISRSNIGKSNHETSTDEYTESDTEYESSNSCEVEPAKPSRVYKPRKVYIPEPIEESGEEYSSDEEYEEDRRESTIHHRKTGINSEFRGVQHVYNNPNNKHAINSVELANNSNRSTGCKERAEPIYRLHDEPRQQRRSEYEEEYTSSRYAEPDNGKIQKPRNDSSSRYIQTHNSGNTGEYSEGYPQRSGLSRESGNRSGGNFEESQRTPQVIPRGPPKRPI